MGRVRLHESRAVSDQLDNDLYDALFSLAPDRFSLGDTSDFLIVEFVQLQHRVGGHHPPGFDRGVLWLLLDQVLRFFPIKADDAWTFKSDAEKAHVEISTAVFEAQWQNWSKKQKVNQACMNGLALSRSLGLDNDTENEQSELDHLHELTMHSLYPVDGRLGVEDFLSSFFTKIESLFDLVRSDADKGAIFISCPVEWVNLRSNTNVLEQNVDLGNMAQLDHEIYWATAFEPSLAGSEGIMRCHDVLQTNAAEYFPGAWTPALITLYVRYSHLIKYGSVNPDEIIAAVNALKKPDDQSSAQLLAFLLGVALGANKVHALERLLDPDRFKITKSHSDESTQPSA